MKHKITGIISDQKGILIPYKDVVQELNIPPEYLVSDIIVLEPFVRLYLIKKAEISFDQILKYEADEYYIKVRRENFIKKFNLEFLDFDVDTIFKNKNNTIIRKVGHSGEEMGYYLEKDSGSVYFWITKKDSHNKEKFFVYTEEVKQ